MISLIAFFGLTVRFSAPMMICHDRDILKEKIKTYLMAQAAKLAS
jgi:hypothetical protein